MPERALKGIPQQLTTGVSNADGFMIIDLGAQKAQYSTIFLLLALLSSLEYYLVLL
jgi:hypothetical protein